VLLFMLMKCSLNLSHNTVVKYPVCIIVFAFCLGAGENQGLCIAAEAGCERSTKE
jgi:hypothetical protein